MSTLSFLKTPLNAAQALAVSKPHHLRTINERIDAIYASEAVMVDFRQRLAEILAAYVDAGERERVIESFERVLRAARKEVTNP